MAQRQASDTYPGSGGLSVCFVTEDFPPSLGGLGISAHRVAGFLRDAGFTVHVVAPTAAASGVDTSEGFTVHRVETSANPLENGLRIHRYVNLLDRQIGFDLFHGFFLPAALACLGPARRRQRPVIASIRGTDASTLVYLPFLRPALLQALRDATWVTSVNQFYLDRLSTDVDLTSRSSVLRNGVPKLERHWQLSSENAGAVGTSGQFRAVKDIPLLIRAFDRARPAAQRLLLVGEFSEPAEERWSKQLIEEFSLQSQVEITGRLPHTQAIAQLQRMHVYVQSSSFEGLPNALLEAVAVGVPVVATAVGGIPEIFTHGVSALLVPHGSPALLADAIRLVLDNPRLAQALSSAAVDLSATFSQQQERSAWVDLHFTLLAAAKKEAKPA